MDGSIDHVGEVSFDAAEGLSVVFKLIKVVSERWRTTNGYELFALVRTGVEFKNGKLVEQTEEKDAA